VSAAALDDLVPIDVLSSIVRIEGGAAIAHADVQIAIGSERQHSPLVIGEWLSNDQEDSFSRSRDIGITRHVIVSAR